MSVGYLTVVCDGVRPPSLLLCGVRELREKGVRATSKVRARALCYTCAVLYNEDEDGMMDMI